MDSQPASSTAAEPPTSPDRRANDEYVYIGSLPRGKTGEDVDTCRICRGEGSADEPLFYPCKCSGSIKFVHQECLMEWLAHSQKKHCELCKTSFRFTKLYHPHMPSTIPTSIFLRRAGMHVLRVLGTWCRVLLVGTVWIILLPWCMRVVWRSLFWVADGGWSRDIYMEFVGRNWTAPVAPATPLPPRFDADTIPPPTRTTNSSNGSVAFPLAIFLAPFSQTLNMSSGEPLAWRVIKRFFLGYSLVDHPSPVGTDAPGFNITHQEYFGSRARHNSLLSNVAFLQWFSSSVLNHFVVDVLEGQIITLLVVVAFVLIFLIREWVVQQQPVINMVGLGGGNAAPVQAVRELEEAPVQDHAVGEDGQEEDEEEEDEEDEDESDSEQEWPRSSLEEGHAEEETREDASSSHRRRSSSSARRQRQALWTTWQNSVELPEDLRLAMQNGSSEDVVRIVERMPIEQSIKLKETLVALAARRKGEFENMPLDAADDAAEAASEKGVDEEAPDDKPRERVKSPQRPPMPSRDQSFIANKIRRDLEEAGSWSFSGLNEDPEEHENPPWDDTNVPESWEHEHDQDEEPKDSSQPPEPDTDHSSDHSSESWQRVPDSVRNPDADDTQDQGQSKAKGKGKAPVDEGVSVEAESADTHVDVARPPSAAESVPPGENSSVSSASGSLREGEERRAPPQPERARLNARRPVGLAERAIEWLWGDVAPPVAQAAEQDGNDEHVVQDIAEEAPFVPFVGNQPRDALANPPIQDPEVAAAAAQAGIDLDQDAIDDAEDLEGIMELIGMQGPLNGLFQNAMFSAVLISATVACAVWVPYLWGKVVLLFLGSPVSLFVKFPLRIVSILADLAVDGVLLAVASMVYRSVQLVHAILTVISLGRLSGILGKPLAAITVPAQSVAQNALDRVGKLILEFSALSGPNSFRLSVSSHAALRTIQNTTSTAFNQAGETVLSWYGVTTSLTFRELVSGAVYQTPLKLQSIATTIALKIQQIVLWLWTAKSYKITLDLGQSVPAAYSSLESWTTTDRLIAILVGYIFFALAGALYLKRGAPLTSSQQGRKIEGIITDVLQQSGGVLKVILIISIEMLAFPLYCGLLLDFAMLPLFEDASLWTRWQFTRSSPWTSGFVHWFVGTCYMFHFALFVSMCRKIMRKGVLYFIRDPDDPTFHPVRDVLERNVTTQLRKIAFSALVYGALVIVCLGGVVWGLASFTNGVLPVHWASHTPSVEFPIEILFYNFLTPVVIKIYKPSDGLHQMYEWWFQACAKSLRLSHFLIGESNAEEEGRHVHPTWSSWFAGDKGDVANPVMPEDDVQETIVLADGRLEKKPRSKVYFAFDGKYVRAPASDQVRIHKGEPVFVEVDRNNNRKDGKLDIGVHARDSDSVTMVYIPPWFRVRIGLFVLAIWAFAAMTGVGVTVIPLLFGRYFLSAILPPTLLMNDIHAFTSGIYILGATAYGLFYLYSFIAASTSVRSPLQTIRRAAAAGSQATLRILRIGYVYTFLILLVPTIFAFLLELYILIPLHSYMGPREPHIIHVIQDWTLGLVYARVAGRVIFNDANSRPARAFAAVTANGYLDPNARLATRYFLVPIVLAFAIATSLPMSLAWSLNRFLWFDASQAFKTEVWRYSYPTVAMLVACAWGAKEGVHMIRRWRMVVRDEVYLIGERLHNFGEKRAAATPSSVSTRVAEAR